MIIDSNDDRPRQRFGEDERPAARNTADGAERPKRERSKKREPAPQLSWKYLAWGLGGVIALLLFLWIGSLVDEFLTIDPRFALTAPEEVGEASPNLQITGMKRADREEVLKVFAPDLGRSIYLVPLAERRGRAADLAQPHSGSTHRASPRGLLASAAHPA
jgi:hypothetical protein